MRRLEKRLTLYLEERLGLPTLWRRLTDRKIPAGVGWAHTLGSATLFLLIVQVVTGIALDKTEKQGKQQPIWQASSHDKAFAVLKTPEVQKVAEKAGVKSAAHEAEQCVKCHTTAAGVAAANLKPSFVKEDGVQCETCHGPGSEYKVMAVMKDHAEAVAAGLTPISVQDGSAEKLCKTCHNQQSPTFKGFNFKEA